VARAGAQESLFGREFDSLADMVSFGVAPRFWLYRIILPDFVKTGWMVAAVYLVCGGIRLARFNILTGAAGAKGGREFLGFPIPSAAALVVSVTMLMMSYTGTGSGTGAGERFALHGADDMLSWTDGQDTCDIRRSKVRGLDTVRSVYRSEPVVVIAALLLVTHFEWTLAILFVGVSVIMGWCGRGSANAGNGRSSRTRTPGERSEVVRV